MHIHHYADYADYLDHLRERMRVAGVTQRALAKAMDVGEIQVSQWFNSIDSPLANSLFRIERAFQELVEQKNRNGRKK